MPVSPARQAAFRILLRVESGRYFAVDLLQSSEVSQLSEADRNLATELVMGTLRWRGELDHRLERLAGKRLAQFDLEVTTALRLGLYQIRFLARVPKSAAVNESVELVKLARKRSAAGLVNAVLRKCPRPPAVRGEGDAPTADELAAARRTLPGWLFKSWEEQFGRESADSLAWASTRVPPTTLRVAAGDREETARRLKEEGIETWPGRFAKCALVVESGGVRGSRALREGDVVIQDEVSQLVAELLSPQPGDKVFDLCAAPGMKTAQLAAAQSRGLLIAADLSAGRLRTLRKLFPAPPALQPHLVRLDASRELPFACSFDRILVDAPCTGTGTLTRNPEIKIRLRPEDVARLAKIQTAILNRALPLLAPNGRLVYSTCSLQREENEGVVEPVLANQPGFRLLSPSERAREFPNLASLFDSRGYFHTRPDRDGMDGFFAAIIVRHG